MPRVTALHSAVATTLVALGIGLICIPSQIGHAIDGYGIISLAAYLLLCHGGGALIGAGLFFPFKRPWTGALMVVIIQAVLGDIIAIFVH